MKLTRWSSLYSTTGTLLDLPWEAICESLRQPAAFGHISDRETHGGYNLGVFKDNKRADDATEYLTGITLDFDKDVSITKALGYFPGLAAVAYTTFSHTAVNARCRVSIPYDRPVTPAEHARIYQYFLAKCEFTADSTSRNPSRFSYLPCVRREVDAPYDCVVQEGVQVAVDMVLQVAPKGIVGPSAPKDLTPDSLLSAAFHHAGLLLRRAPNGRDWYVICPNAASHTQGKPGDSSSVVFSPTAESTIGQYHCSHHGCLGDKANQNPALVGWRNVLKLLPEESQKHALNLYPTAALTKPKTELSAEAKSYLMPDGFEVVDGKLFADVAIKQDQGQSFAGKPIEYERVLVGDAITILAILIMPDGKQTLRLRNEFTGKTLELERSLLADSKNLQKILAGMGTDMVLRQAKAYVLWIETSLRMNDGRIPISEARLTTGWDEGCNTFMLGLRCVGGDDEIFGLANDPGGHARLKSIRTGGSAAAWREGATKVLEAVPCWGLVLAAAIADPIICLTGHRRIGIITTGAGGKGKSAMLRFAASVWGYTGSDNDTTGAGLIGSLRRSNTYLGSLRQFSRLKHVPHLADEIELRTNSHDQEDLLACIIDGCESARSVDGGKGLQAMPPFPACTLAGGEVDEAETVRRQGTARRFLPLRAPFTPNEKIFPFIMPDVVNNYGWFAEAVVECLVGMGPVERAKLKGHNAPELSRIGPRPDDAIGATRWDQHAAILAAIDISCGLCPDIAVDRAMWMESVLSTVAGINRRTELLHTDQPTWMKIRDAIQTLIAQNQGYIFGMCGEKTPDRPIGKYIPEQAVVALSCPEVRKYLKQFSWSIGTFFDDLQENGVIIAKGKSGQDAYEHVTRVGKAQMRCFYFTVEVEEPEAEVSLL